MARIHLKSLSKRFKGGEAVRGVDLTIEDGTFFTLAGPSGCGKSTLLNMIAGLETPSGGAVYFDDREVTPLPPGERDVAFVFQSYALYPHMTVFENIAFPLRIRKVKEADVDKKVREVADLLGLTDLLDRLPKALSGGQRQRVALGRAIIRRPRLFLLDEPLSNLDALLRVEMRSEIKRLHQTLGATIIYVTHDQAEAMVLSDRIAVMERGVVHQCGTPDEIYNRPANRFVARFFGSPPMNFMNGRLLPGDPPQIVFAETRFPLPKNLLPGMTRQADPIQCLVGIRPDEITLSKVHGSGNPAGLVRVVEPMGSETWVVFTLMGAELRGKGGPDLPLRPGDPVDILFHPEKIHLFDIDTGNRIGKG
ncbi:MAG: ABC transporter ATP-binding protein [Nitrospiria bacterium]